MTHRSPPDESARRPASEASAKGTGKHGIPPLLIDASAAADLLSIGRRKLWELTNRGAIPSRRIGRAVRYSVADLRDWVANGCPSEPRAASRPRKGGER